MVHDTRICTSYTHMLYTPHVRGGVRERRKKKRNIYIYTVARVVFVLKFTSEYGFFFFVNSERNGLGSNELAGLYYDGVISAVYTHPVDVIRY